MNVKTFEAPTLAEAMGLVRAELGDDAMIVATRSETNGVCRVIAAIDHAAPAPAPTPPPEPAPPPVARNPRVKPAPWITGATSAAKSASDASSREATMRAVALKALDLHRTTDAVRVAFAKHADEQRGDIKATLAAMFRFDSVRNYAKRRCIVLVGPPGAGKTALAAKLAAHHVLAGGRAKLIAADMVTTGGTDRLRAFARVLGVSVHQAERPAMLRELMVLDDGDDLNIVDTAAVNCRNTADLTTLAELAGARSALPVLVLPAGIDAEDAAEMAKLFAELGCTHLAATRLDASWRLGGILAAAHAGGLALAEASTAPTIASGLTQLNAHALLSRLLAPAGPKATPQR
jgi:flagellar biosynthesis protein FlhF